MDCKLTLTLKELSCLREQLKGNQSILNKTRTKVVHKNVSQGLKLDLV